MEDFGYQRDGEEKKFSDLTKRTFLVIATLFSLAAFVYITINAYYYVYQDSNNSDIETIKSPEGAIKVLEEDQTASGNNSMQIDRTIYEDIFGSKKEKLNAENAKLRGSPEPALPPKVLPTKITKDAPQIVIKENPAPQAVTPQEQKIVVYENQKNDKANNKDLLTKMDGEKRDNTAAPERKAAANKKVEVRVQVAAMTSKEAAEEHWKKLNRLYSSLFSGLRPFVEKVDLGKRGIFYRLQIGVFYNQVAAEEFCNRYVTQAQKSRADCILVE